jgi:hypothetical protein
MVSAGTRTGASLNDRGSRVNCGACSDGIFFNEVVARLAQHLDLRRPRREGRGASSDSSAAFGTLFARQLIQRRAAPPSWR